MSSYGPLEGVKDDKIEGTVLTKVGIRKGTDGKVMEIKHVETCRIKLRGYSLGNALGSEGGSEVDSSDEIKDGNIVGKIEGS